MLTNWIPLSTVALALGLLATPASAAPVGSLNGVKPDVGTAAETVTDRRCWWRDGRRHCHSGKVYGYGPGVGVYIGDGRRHGHRHGYGHRRDRHDHDRGHHRGYR